ncbi:MAG: protein phosphatase 2C domain-containing protein [Chloroflexi bacterium]|nr:protein phosphatase 2C domain-containing protein [Chloroflexota bacterium]
MKCPTCGRDNRKNAGFCAWCGAHLQPIEQNPPEPVLAEVPPADVEGHIPLTSEVAETTPPPAEEPDTTTATCPQGVEPAQGPAGHELQVGDLLAGRYRIIEQLEVGEERRVYRAHDLSCCPACGYDDNKPGDPFCARCGASLETPCRVTVIEKMRQPPETYDLAFQEGDRDYYVRIEPRQETLPGEGRSIPPKLRLVVGHATDAGRQHELNEDTVDTWLYTRSNGDVLGLFVVADGLGGQDSGEVASQMAVQTLWETLRKTVWEPFLRGEAPEPDETENQLLAAVRAANQAVYEARIERESSMSTTMTVALVLGDRAHIANVGDSRTYVLGTEGLRRITHDHSLVQRLVDTNKIRPEEVYTHPQRNLIYQSVGDRPDVQVDAFRHQLQPDERLVLCSDGLWETVRDEGIEEVLLAEQDPQRASEQLVHNANVAGGEDNISVIIVQALASSRHPGATFAQNGQNSAPAPKDKEG